MEKKNKDLLRKKYFRVLEEEVHHQNQSKEKEMDQNIPIRNNMMDEKEDK